MGDRTNGPGHEAEVRTGGGPAQDAEIRTFLIADVRGYTKFTREHGDHAAATLAATFAELARQVVEAHRGILLELRGDEALAVFVSARQALRAAVQFQQRLEQTGLPRGVGIGLDSGEAIPVGEGYRGGALNLAARLCGQAGPGQILASEGVIHLAAKVEGLAYVDPRVFKLKGYAEPVRAVEVVPAERARRYTFRRKITRRARHVLSRRAARVGMAGVVVIALLAVFLPRVLTGRGGSVLENDPAGMAIVDAKSGRQLGFVPTSVLKSPLDAFFADGHFWVFNGDPTSFVEVDPKTGAVLAQIPTPVENVGSFGVGGNDLWVTDGDHPILVQVDSRLRREVNRYTLSDDPDYGGLNSGLTVAEGSVWVHGNGETLRVDPATGKVQAKIGDGFGVYPLRLAYGDGSIWASAYLQGQGGLIRIDPKTNEVVAKAVVSPHQGSVTSVAAGAGYGWTADNLKGMVYKVDPSGTVLASYRTGDGANALSFADGTAWVGNEDVGTVVGIDEVTGRQITHRFEHPVNAVAAGSGSLLVALNQGRTYEDQINALQGKVAKFFVQANQLDGDPADTWSLVGWEVEYATCAKLLNYPDQPAPGGWKLQPEVAASMPEVSADRRTYTFTIRPGYRFSPPSNQTVTAETFRHSIERALSPKVGGLGATPGMSMGSLFIQDIRGEQAFIGGKADHISGLQASGNTLTITLSKPSPDFLERLAMPFFCPVPTDTPTIPGGAVVEEGGVTAVASAGPYYIADMHGGKFAILKRNPNYTGPRPHALDAIALREGIDPGEAVARVESGSWDGITNVGDPLLDDPQGSLAKAWGPGGTSAAREGQRYYAAVPDGSQQIYLNAGRPLFSQLRVREAVGYAIDRPALATLSPYGAGLPTDQLLLPNQPGSRVPPTFPVDGPDLEKAKELMHGTRGVAVLVVSEGCASCHPAAQAVKAELAPIGIDVRIKDVPSSIDAYSQPGAPYDMKIAADNGEFYLDPLAYLLRDRFIPHPSHDWFPADVRAAVARLGDEPDLDGVLAVLHNTIMKEVPIIGVSYQVSAAFFSPHVGCRVFPPASFGVDFAGLCLAG